MSGVFPGEFDAPDAAANGVFINGAMTATFPGVPYKRYIRNIQVFCTAGNTNVILYLEAITPSAQIAQNQFGANNTWGPVNTRPIPYNSSILVVWPLAKSTDSAYCVISAGGVIGG